MPVPVTGIHVLTTRSAEKTWMAGTKPGHDRNDIECLSGLAGRGATPENGPVLARYAGLSCRKSSTAISRITRSGPLWILAFARSSSVWRSGWI